VWGFPFILILHSVGLAFLVGTCVAVDARLLGAGRAVPLSTLIRFYRVMWIGFWVNAVSGVLLLWAYPTKALTNPLFYVKLTLIVVGLVIAEWVRRRVLAAPAYESAEPPGRVKLVAAVSLGCWLTAVTAGRLLAYTYSHLMADV
jgi:hypothetical protein